MITCKKGLLPYSLGISIDATHPPLYPDNTLYVTVPDVVWKEKHLKQQLDGKRHKKLGPYLIQWAFRIANARCSCYPSRHRLPMVPGTALKEVQRLNGRVE